MNLNKIMPSKKELFKHISDLDVYRCYMKEGEVDFGKPILSPLREEKRPSFGFFVGENNEILFNDFKYGGGDCIRFVEIMFGDTFFEAISRIIIDFQLTDLFEYKQVDTNFTPKPKSDDRDDLLKTANSSKIGKKRRDWTLRDLAFWKQYGINKDTLEAYNVEPLEYVFINDKVIKCTTLTYCFIERKDNVETYKIYQPFNEKFKWINNHNDSVWQGWENLPKSGDTLIITKSLKDVMTITSLTDIPAVSLQAESVMPKQSVMDELKKRFKTILLWYDNDFDKEVNWGRQFAEKLAEEFDLTYIEIPDEHRAKDISDYVKEYGEKDGEVLIYELVEQLPF